MIQDIIFDTFQEWTSGLNPRQCRIEIFEHIRDIPFGLIPELVDPEELPVYILTHGKGSCSPKHFLLGIMYEMLHIPIKYATYSFYWNEQDTKYPGELRKLAEHMPLQYHIACKGFINQKWILLDATYDPPLKKAGFPINETWDGMSETLNAVKPFDEIIHKNVKELIEYMGIKTAQLTDTENSLNQNFFYELGKWLEDVRMEERVEESNEKRDDLKI